MILYCPTCREVLNGHGEVISTFYDQICEHYIMTGTCLELCTPVHDYLMPMLRFLEKKRYIITTESELIFLQAKPLGIKFTSKPNEDNDLDSICLVCFNNETHQASCQGCDEAHKQL